MNTSQSAIDHALAVTEAQRAHTEVEREIGPLLRVLDISPTVLAKLDSPTLLMLVSQRMFKLLSLKLRALDAALASLREAHAAQPVQPLTRKEIN